MFDATLRGYIFIYFIFIFFNPLPVALVGLIEALDGRPLPVSGAG